MKGFSDRLSWRARGVPPEPLSPRDTDAVCLSREEEALPPPTNTPHLPPSLAQECGVRLPEGSRPVQIHHLGGGEGGEEGAVRQGAPS